MIIALSACGGGSHGHNPDGDFSCDYERPVAPVSQLPSLTQGELLGTFRVLTANVFGQSQDSLGEILFVGDEVCQKRLKQIGVYIRDAQPPYDIVGLEEWHSDNIHTCNGVVLKNRLDDLDSSLDTQLYDAPKGYEWSHHRWGHPEANDQNDGGVGLFARIPYLWEKYSSGEFDDVFVETENVHQFYPRLKARSAHGFMFARLYQDYPDVGIDVYVVHLTSTQSDPNKCDEQCKALMLGQLREGIHERSAESGFPVLVMGDFNIGGPNPTTAECAGSKRYGTIMESLGHPSDVWLSAHPGEQGGTYAWLSERPERIDYMFIVNDPYLTNSEFELSVRDPSSVQLIDWHLQVGVSDPPDHRGLEATFELRKKPQPLRAQAE